MKFIWLFFAIALGDIAFLYPSKEQRLRPVDGNVTIPLMLIDDHSSPAVDDINSLNIGLCTGPNDNITLVGFIKEKLDPEQAIVEGKGGKRNWSYNLTIPDTFTDDGLYYLQITSLYQKSQLYHIHYSQRFKLENMDHKSNKTLDHGSMDEPPDPDTATHEKGSSSSKNFDKYYTIPYDLQTGSVRYAPMQQTVGSAYKKKRWSGSATPSSKEPFKTLATKANVEYTITQPPTYTIKTGDNTYPGIKTRLSHYHAQSKIKKPFLRSTASSV